MQTAHVHQAATLLWRAWQSGERVEELPAALRPSDRAEGYAIQAEVARLSGQAVSGWKIAATSTAGQAHIGVDGPLAGRLLRQRVYGPGASCPLATNLMRVAEAEFAFRLARSLPPRPQPYAMEEVLEAVDSVYPAIELPDARYRDFARVGAPQLIADHACADCFVLGTPVQVPWRHRDLAAHRVTMHRNGSLVREGVGANVLGDPRLALTWLAQELATYDTGLQAGQLVTTGTCIVPVEIVPGDRLLADFGDFGQVAAVLT